jgi:hypothetical protein
VREAFLQFGQLLIADARERMASLWDQLDLVTPRGAVLLGSSAVLAIGLFLREVTKK